MNLGDKIITLRKQRHWSQEDLADQLNVSRQSVSKWEMNASLPELDKIVKMSEIFEVSTDYLLKDGEAKKETVCAEEKNASLRMVTYEESEDFLEVTRKSSITMSLGIALLITSPILVILLEGKSAERIGIAMLLVIVALGVTLIISTGMKLSKYEYLSKENFCLEKDVLEIVMTDKQAHDPVFRRRLVSSIAIFILSVIPVILTDENEGATALLLLLVAVGVYFIVQAAMVRSGYEKLLQIENYSPEKKFADRKLSVFSGIYWCVVTAIYLAVCFKERNWGFFWLIWAVAGCLYAALELYLKYRIKNKMRSDCHH